LNLQPEAIATSNSDNFPETLLLGCLRTLPSCQYSVSIIANDAILQLREAHGRGQIRFSNCFNLLISREIGNVKLLENPQSDFPSLQIEFTNCGAIAL